MRTNEKPLAKQSAQQMYDRARSNLLLMIILTVVNIILFIAGSDSMMLFSATVPYMSIVLGIVSEINVVFLMCSIISATTVILYLICWIFSKKNVSWMIVALVCFIIDTIILAGIYLILQEFSGILDFLIHIWVLYYLVIGVRYGYRLKKLPEVTADTTSEASTSAEDANTTALYVADVTTKARILLEVDTMGYSVCYRRIKRTNELVINGCVYDSVELLIEPPHKLSAKLGGHLFQVGYDGLHSYVRVDGELIAKKIRIW